MKTNSWTYKLKYLNREKTIASFSEKKLFLSILLMSYYPELDSHIRDKVKVVLDLPNFATKKELEQATSFDTSDLAAKKNSIGLKAVEKLGDNKLTNVSINLNDLERKLKTVSVNLKKLSNVVDYEDVKNKKIQHT